MDFYLYKIYHDSQFQYSFKNLMSRENGTMEFPLFRFFCFFHLQLIQPFSLTAATGEKMNNENANIYSNISKRCVDTEEKMCV